MSNGVKPLKVSLPVRHELERWVRAPNMPQKQVLRARIVLGAADGLSNSELANQLGTSRPTVIHWRRRFARAPGIVGLRPLDPGRKKTLTAEKIAAIELATQSTPPDGIRWSTRALARAQGVSHSSVFRIWKDRQLQIHREAFKVRDIAGLYLNSVDAVAAFIEDNNSQIQAPHDTQPALHAERRVFLRRSHKIGTECELEGLRVSEVLCELVRREGGSSEPLHRLVAFLTFLGQLHKNREVHLVALDWGLLRHPSIQEWFSAHARYHVHHVPVDSEFYSASDWIGIVERWLTEISREGRPNRAARNVRDLLDAIAVYLEKGGQEFPFAWWAPPLGRFHRRRIDGRTQGMTLKLIALLEVMLTKGRAAT